jgi:hypothetical protein
MHDLHFAHPSPVNVHPGTIVHPIPVMVHPLPVTRPAPIVIHPAPIGIHPVMQPAPAMPRPQMPVIPVERFPLPQWHQLAPAQPAPPQGTGKPK